MPKMNKAEIDNEDLWILLLSTIRYSMGRQTYMPDVCLRMLKVYRDHLTNDQLRQIAREVHAEQEKMITLGRKLGSTYDHQIWSQVYNEALTAASC